MEGARIPQTDTGQKKKKKSKGKKKADTQSMKHFNMQAIQLITVSHVNWNKL